MQPCDMHVHTHTHTHTHTHLHTPTHTSMHHFNSHFPDESGLAGCPLNILLHSFLNCILLRKALRLFTFSHSPWYNPTRSSLEISLCCSIIFHCHTAFYPIDIILTPNISKSPILDNWKNLFQSQQFSDLCAYFHFFQWTTTDKTNAYSLQLYLNFHLHWPGLTAMYQAAPHKTGV